MLNSFSLRLNSLVLVVADKGSSTVHSSTSFLMVASSREKFSQTFSTAFLDWQPSCPIPLSKNIWSPSHTLRSRVDGQIKKRQKSVPPFCKDIRNTSRSTSRLRQPVVLLVPWTGKLKSTSYQVCYPLNTLLALDIVYIVVTSIHYARLKCVKWRKVKWKWWILTRLPLFVSPDPEEPKSWTKVTSNLLQVI